MKPIFTFPQPRRRLAEQSFHLKDRKTCPNKRSHRSWLNCRSVEGGWRISSRACAGGCSVRRKVPSTGNIPVHVCTSATGRVCTAWPRKGHDIMSCCPLVAEHFETECVFLCPQTWTTKEGHENQVGIFHTSKYAICWGTGPAPMSSRVL